MIEFPNHWGRNLLPLKPNSPTAIQVNIQTIRVFTRTRELMLTQKDIFVKLEQIEKELLNQNWRIDKHEQDITMIFNALKELLNPPGFLCLKTICPPSWHLHRSHNHGFQV